MFITPAFAQATSLGPLTDILSSPVAFMVPIFIIFYFFMIRPQQRRQKEHQELIKNVRRGDTVITSGGLVGKVTKLVDDEQIEIEISDGVRVRQLRQLVSDVRAKGEPVKEESA
ncbi:MAG TPA: preprotein translocase subunit YajC [Xanthobacteraceae bacterium]|jgi:preprotein translocase subunit YajC|nr:preprotein translocase subunit YajC [Xanthobacteraceae bacterium]